ncbi:DUF3153 domain-containing protein [Dactylococcopsis salina]|uniref:DUF3153 domain-containing protein n=1 Tax=Dactylococcopsis salina (strain PCC 8305) TaxID=13035 RepID=K9YYS7_DACS8|nr:DUF3153 domain-containing protein [Dactylococcopsis salina]AFZ52079.1 Protein of unknown function (DUF3153) [Dactylococcopsis salina PCC 8305]
MNMINFFWKRFFLLIIPFLLTSCVNYDVGIDITGLHRGKIIQQIELGEQLTSFSQADIEDWLGSLQNRSKQLGGETKRLSPQSVQLTIPFANIQQLETKFNQFFNPNTNTQPPSELVRLKSQLTTQQKNFLLFQRTQLKLNVDLTALGTIKSKNSQITGTNSLLDLKFRLKTPQNPKIITPDSTDQSFLKQMDKETIWYLQPGENNEIAVVFWSVEPLGWGASAIVAIVYIGLRFKYPHSPCAQSDS